MRIGKINFTVNRNGIKNTLTWFICFGLSFLAQALNIVDQGTAFAILYIAVSCFFFAFGLLKIAEALGEKMIAIACIMFIISFGLTVLFSWLATKIFDTDITTAFQLITLGQIITQSSGKD